VCCKWKKQERGVLLLEGKTKHESGVSRPPVKEISNQRMREWGLTSGKKIRSLFGKSPNQKKPPPEWGTLPLGEKLIRVLFFGSDYGKHPRKRWGRETMTKVLVFYFIGGLWSEKSDHFKS